MVDFTCYLWYLAVLPSWPKTKWGRERLGMFKRLGDKQLRPPQREQQVTLSKCKCSRPWQKTKTDATCVFRFLTCSRLSNATLVDPSGSCQQNCKSQGASGHLLSKNGLQDEPIWPLLDLNFHKISKIPVVFYVFWSVVAYLTPLWLIQAALTNKTANHLPSIWTLPGQKWVPRWAQLATFGAQVAQDTPRCYWCFSSSDP